MSRQSPRKMRMWCFLSRKTGSGRPGATWGVSIAVAEILDDLDKEADEFPRFWGASGSLIGR